MPLHGLQIRGTHADGTGNVWRKLKGRTLHATLLIDSSRHTGASRHGFAPRCSIADLSSAVEGSSHHHGRALAAHLPVSGGGRHDEDEDEEDQPPVWQQVGLTLSDSKNALQLFTLRARRPKSNFTSARPSRAPSAAGSEEDDEDSREGRHALGAGGLNSSMARSATMVRRESRPKADLDRFLPDGPDWEPSSSAAAIRNPGPCAEGTVAESMNSGMNRTGEGPRLSPAAEAAARAVAAEASRLMGVAAEGTATALALSGHGDRRSTWADGNAGGWSSAIEDRRSTWTDGKMEGGASARGGRSSTTSPIPPKMLGGTLPKRPAPVSVRFNPATVRVMSPVASLSPSELSDSMTGAFSPTTARILPTPGSAGSSDRPPSGGADAHSPSGGGAASARVRGAIEQVEEVMGEVAMGVMRLISVDNLDPDAMLEDDDVDADGSSSFRAAGSVAGGGSSTAAAEISQDAILVVDYCTMRLNADLARLPELDFGEGKGLDRWEARW